MLDMAGVVRCWAGDAMAIAPVLDNHRVVVAEGSPDSDFMCVRGGAFNFNSWRSADRNGNAPHAGDNNISIRLVRSYPS